MLSQKERINLLRRILEGWKNVRLEVFGHKVPKSHCGLSSALTGVDRSEAILQKYAGFTPARDFADWPEYFGTQYAQYRALGLDHVFSSTCDPHLPPLASNKQTTVLVTAASHSSPLFRAVGSSAFSYVDFECSAHVKQPHGSLGDVRPRQNFLSVEAPILA
jgi:hypothetical protein